MLIFSFAVGRERSTEIPLPYIERSSVFAKIEICIEDGLHSFIISVVLYHGRHDRDHRRPNQGKDGRGTLSVPQNFGVLRHHRNYMIQALFGRSLQSLDTGEQNTVPRKGLVLLLEQIEDALGVHYPTTTD